MVMRLRLFALLLLLASSYVIAADTGILEVQQFGSRQKEENRKFSVIAMNDGETIRVRQQYKIWIEIETVDKFASLQADELVIPGFQVIPMQPQRQQHDNGATLKAGWLLFPSKPGNYSIVIPAINYLLGGKVQNKVLAPRANVQVQALPPYVPPTMPVGKITIENVRLQSNLLRINSLTGWQIHMSSNNVRPEDFPPLMRQLGETDEFEFFPADTSRTTQPQATGIQSSVLHDIPYKAITSGIHGLPTLQIQYFDPASGRIITKKHATGNIVAFHLITWFLLVLASFYVIYKSLKMSFGYSRSAYTQHKAIQAAGDTIKKATTPAGLREALRDYARAKRWPYNKPVSSWVNTWPVKKQRQQNLQEAMTELSQLCYSRQPVGQDLEATRNKFISALLQ